MKKNNLSIIFIVLLLFFSQSFAASILETKSKELQSVNQQISGLTDNLHKETSQRQTLEQQLQSIEISIGQIANDISKINQKLKIEKNKLQALNRQHFQYQQQLQQQQLELALQIRSAYMLGQNQYIKLLLNQKDPKSISRLLMYYRYISTARIKIIRQLNATLKNLAENETAIKSQSAKYAQLFESEQNQRLDLQQRLHQRKMVLTQLNKQIQTKSQKLQELKTNRAELQNLINHLKTQRQNFVEIKIPFINMKGKMHWPTHGRITKDFGYRIDSSGTTYNGVFISAPMGEPIYAIYPGQVVFANWLRGVGLLVIIQHDGDFMTLYGHDHSILVNTGQYVHQGQEIATVGKSGGYNKTGLFFQIRKDGNPLNPDNWCS